MSSHPARHRVVVVGGGFGGIQATLKLARMPVDVTLVDRRNFHLFQPLAYQVATGVLSPAEICYPLRRIFRRRRNVEVVLAEVHDVDLAARRVMLRPVVGQVAPESIPYDTLIVSGGSEYSYFGHDEWREPAAELMLGAFPPSLSAKAQRSLQRLGVTPLVGQAVVDLDHDAVTVKAADREPERIPSRTVVWAAGVVASELAGVLARRAGHEVDRAGRVEVLGDLTLPDHPEVLAIGDMVRVRQDDGESLVYPGVAPVAMQQGRYAARVVRDRLRGREVRPFRYLDKGNLATIGRAAAVADIKGLKLSGFIAWITWLVVHLWYLIGFQNRLLVIIRWSFSFFMRGTRGARLITYQDTVSPAEAPRAVD